MCPVGRRAEGVGRPQPTQDLCGKLTAHRDGPVAIENQRIDPGLEQPVALVDPADEHRREGREEVLVEDEVAKAVDHELAAVPLESLDDVRVVTDDDVGARVDALMCRLAEELRGRLGELEATVNLDDDEIDAGLS